MLKSYPMAALDSHTVTSSSLKTVFDNDDDHSSLTATCACRAPSPAICSCSHSQSLNSGRGRELATKDLLSTVPVDAPTEPQPSRLTLKLTLPPQFKQHKQLVPTLASSLQTVPHLQDQQTPPQRKRGRGRPSQIALEISATRSPKHNGNKPPSQSALPAKASSRSFTKSGAARVKAGTATSNPRPRRRRSSSNFSDTVPRRGKHDSSANIAHQQPAYPLFLPASVLSSGDLSSSSVTLSESSDTDDQCDSSPSPVSLSPFLSIGDEQADRGHTHHHQSSYDQQVHLERARVRRELLGHDQSPSHHQQHHAHNHNHNHNHNQQDHARAHHPPLHHPTAGGGRSLSGDETEDERSSSGNVGSSDSDDGTESDDGDPNIIKHPNPKLTTRFPATAIEIDPDSGSESEIDAELFFSNLIKSASSSSSSDGDSDDSDDGNEDEDEDADEVMLDVEIGVEIPGTGRSGGNDEVEVNDDGGGDDGHNNDNSEETQRGPADPAMMVREGWDGALVFATDIGTQGRGGVLDAAFERSSSWSRERAPSVPRMHSRTRAHIHTHTSTHTGLTTARAGRRTMSVSSNLNLPLDVIAELQAAAETKLLGTGLMSSMSLSTMDPFSALSDTEEGGVVEATDGEGRGDDETDEGETTDDELPFVPLPGMEGMGGVGMRFLLPPTAPPVLSVNPDVTMSPSTSKRVNSRREFAVGESPRPAEILQRQQMQVQMQRRWTTSGEGPALTNTPQALNNSTDSPEKLSLPKMGVFGPPGLANGLSLSTSSKAGAVIGKQTAKGSIPSPFAKLGRNTGPDAGSAGGCTPTTPSLPARSRKRRASVSVCCYPLLSLSTKNASLWSLQSDLTPFFNKRSMRFPTTGVDMFSSFPPPHMHPMFAGDLFPSSPGSLFDYLPPESTPENSVIELDDVLCASVLSDDTAPTSLGGDVPESETTVDGEGVDAGIGARQVSRWDRVPVGLYRQMRTGNGTEEMMFSFGIGGFGSPASFEAPGHHHHHTHQHHHHHHHSIAGPSTSHGLPRAQHRPGVSLDSALWGLTNTGAPDGLFEDGFGQMFSAGVVPPPLPLMGDGERATTPTPSLYVPETKSRKERRKEKKKEKMRAAAAAAAAAACDSADSADAAVPASALLIAGAQQDYPETLMECASQSSP